MLNIIDALSNFFTTSVGQYWIYVYCGLGVVTCIFIIFDNIK